MPTSETGNKFRPFLGGYTLLEIMAVITLVGLMALLIYPEFNISPERNEVIYIGKLLKADIGLVKEEAFSQKEELVINFTARGYSYPVNETNILREFTRYQFAFDVPAPKEESTGGPGEEEPAPTPVDTAGDRREGSAGEGVELGPNQIMFASNGKCNQFELGWQTIHFTGKLKVGQDGEAEWSYAKK